MATLGTIEIPAARTFTNSTIKIVVTGVRVFTWRMNIGAWLLAIAVRIAGFPKVELLIVNPEVEECRGR